MPTPSLCMMPLANNPSRQSQNQIDYRCNSPSSKKVLDTATVSRTARHPMSGS
ncbi:Uncharacterised protein [Slackia heliotrinireducens]|nr:Uncharacterised protein [Slackia heliotrinireducens]